MLIQLIASFIRRKSLGASLAAKIAALLSCAGIGAILWLGYQSDYSIQYGLYGIAALGLISLLAAFLSRKKVKKKGIKIEGDDAFVGNV
jgi:hypothetical protein